MRCESRIIFLICKFSNEEGFVFQTVPIRLCHVREELRPPPAPTRASHLARAPPPIGNVLLDQGDCVGALSMYVAWARSRV